MRPAHRRLTNVSARIGPIPSENENGSKRSSRPVAGVGII
jgi:hypothetical protein